MLDGRPALVSDRELTAWIESSARAIAAYYGRFPVSRAVVAVHGGGRGKVSSGRTVGVRGVGRIAISVGDEATPGDLSRNWELVHEMVHLAFPSMTGEPWIEEGLATYVEPLVRVRAGLAPGEEIWKWLLWGLPRGQQALAGTGLSGARSWAAAYWGGALFCFDADVAIRERTGGRKSLDDALRGIVREGGNVTVSWPIERAFAVGDRATGTTVLRDLYVRMRDRPPSDDLPAVFARLGVREGGSGVVFDDAAPLAQVRKGITTGK